MKAITTFFAFALYLFCSCGEDSPTNSSSTTYKYTSYTENGNIIITGYLWIESVDSTTIMGRWDFKLVGSEENLGPQIGKGNFEGQKDSRGSMQINLNPGFIDNNVILDGSLLNLDYNGTWSYIGFPGVINSGSFEAKQLR